MSGQLATLTFRELMGLNLGEREVLLGPWLRRRHLNLTYAPAGLGKSWFVLSLALAVAGGGRAFGWQAPAPRPVLFVDGEMDVADLKDRAAMLAGAVEGLDREAVATNFRLLAQQHQAAGVRFPDLARLPDHKRVVRLVERDKTALVVLDNFSTLATVEDENAASSFDPVISLMRDLRQRDAACILVHHARKNPGTAGGGYRGTSKMAVIFNSVTQLAAAESDPLHRGAAFGLQWEKVRELRDDTMQPLEARLVPAEGGKPARWQYGVSEGGREAQLVQLAKTLQYRTQDALAVALGVSKGTVSKLKARAIANARVTDKEWSGWLAGAEEIARAAEEDDPYRDDVPAGMP